MLFQTSNIIKLTIIAFAWLLMTAFTSNLNRVVNVVIDDSTLTEYQKKMYEKDATRLALRYISKGTDFADLSPQAPQEVTNELYVALLAVYHSPFSEALTVSKTHRLHTFPNPSVDNLQVIYNNQAKWATPLKLGDKKTDNAKINSLCKEFNLKIHSHEIWDDEKNLFMLKADKALNMAAIAKQLETIEEINTIKLLIPSTDGNDIEATKTAKGWKLKYIIKFDSCFTGCKKQHIWTFEILNITANSANVNFIEESGDDLPDWMQIKTQPSDRD